MPVTALRFDKRKVVYGGWGLIGMFDRQHRGGLDIKADELHRTIVDHPANIVSLQFDEEVLMCSYFDGRSVVDVYRPVKYRNRNKNKKTNMRTKKPKQKTTEADKRDDDQSQAQPAPRDAKGKGNRCSTM